MVAKSYKHVIAVILEKGEIPTYLIYNYQYFKKLSLFANKLFAITSLPVRVD